MTLWLAAVSRSTSPDKFPKGDWHKISTNHFFLMLASVRNFELESCTGQPDKTFDPLLSRIGALDRQLSSTKVIRPNFYWVASLMFEPWTANFELESCTGPPDKIFDPLLPRIGALDRQLSSTKGDSPKFVSGRKFYVRAMDRNF